MILSLSKSIHHFEQQAYTHADFMYSIINEDYTYIIDRYKCSVCGVGGRKLNNPNGGLVVLSQDLKVLTCTYPLEELWVKIIECAANKPYEYYSTYNEDDSKDLSQKNQYSRCAPNTLHKVIKPPKNTFMALWVMGVDEPITLFAKEYQLIIKRELT